MATTVNLASLQRAICVDAQQFPAHSHLRAVFPYYQTKDIIGYKGQTAKRIQQTKGIYLQVFNAEGHSWGRLLGTRGQPDMLARAWNDIFNVVINEYSEYYRHKGYSINFVFPSDLVDLFLDQGVFETITNECQDVRILVKRECLMRSTERVVRVSIKDSSPLSLRMFEKTVYLLAKQVQNNLRLALSAPGNKFYIEHQEDDIYRYINNFEHHYDTFFKCNRKVKEDEKTIDVVDEWFKVDNIVKRPLIEQVTQQHVDESTAISYDSVISTCEKEEFQSKQQDSDINEETECIAVDERKELQTDQQIINEITQTIHHTRIEREEAPEIDSIHHDKTKESAKSTEVSNVEEEDIFSVLAIDNHETVSAKPSQSTSSHLLKENDEGSEEDEFFPTKSDISSSTDFASILGDQEEEE